MDQNWKRFTDYLIAQGIDQIGGVLRVTQRLDGDIAAMLSSGLRRWWGAV